MLGLVSVKIKYNGLLFGKPSCANSELLHRETFFIRENYQTTMQCSQVLCLKVTYYTTFQQINTGL